MSWSNDIFAAGVVIVIGAALAVLAVTILDNGGINYDSEHTIEYEDYIKIEKEPLGADGSIEIVDVAGVQYAHASSTGFGSVTYTDGSVERWKVLEADAVLVIMDGQSQAAYYGNADTPPDPSRTVGPEIGRGFYFGYPDSMPYKYNEDVSDCRIYDFVDPATGEVRVGDKGPLFCRTYGELTGKKTVWVSLGIPARAIASWVPGDSSLAWNQNIKVMKAFNGELDGRGFRIVETFVMWAQGEADRANGTSAATYMQRFTAFHDAAPEAWGRTIDHWYIFQGRTGTGTNGCGPVINGALAQLAETLPDASLAITHPLLDTFTQANGLLLDGGHFTQEGDNAVAIQAARTICGATDRAPVYLMREEIAVEQGEALALDPWVRSATTDMRTVNLPVEWEETEVDTSALGTREIAGTLQETSASIVPFAPGPVAVVTVAAQEGEP